MISSGTKLMMFLSANLVVLWGTKLMMILGTKLRMFERTKLTMFLGNQSSHGKRSNDVLC